MHSGMLAPAEKPRDSEVEAGGQMLADTKAGGQKPTDAKIGGQKPANAKTKVQRSEGQRGPKSESEDPQLARSRFEREDKSMRKSHSIFDSF